MELRTVAKQQFHISVAWSRMMSCCSTDGPPSSMSKIFRKWHLKAEWVSEAPRLERPLTANGGCKRLVRGNCRPARVRGTSGSSFPHPPPNASERQVPQAKAPKKRRPANSRPRFGPAISLWNASCFSTIDFAQSLKHRGLWTLSTFNCSHLTSQDLLLS